MSSHPNALLIASIRPPSGQPDEYLRNENGEYTDIEIGDELYDIVIDENTDLGIYPEEEHFAIYTYLTYGWGDTISLETALENINKFKNAVEKYCEEYNCTYKMHLGANFY